MPLGWQQAVALCDPDWRRIVTCVTVNQPALIEPQSGSGGAAIGAPNGNRLN
jgi:hypothetical protein